MCKACSHEKVGLGTHPIWCLLTNTRRPFIDYPPPPLFDHAQQYPPRHRGNNFYPIRLSRFCTPGQGNTASEGCRFTDRPPIRGWSRLWRSLFCPSRQQWKCTSTSTRGRGRAIAADADLDRTSLTGIYLPPKDAGWRLSDEGDAGVGSNYHQLYLFIGSVVVGRSEECSGVSGSWRAYSGAFFSRCDRKL